MAERTQYQYQPVTGPVWSEPVASRLAWLPSGQWQPTRALPPNRLGDFTQPAFDALYSPERLQWVPSDRYIGQSLRRAALDYSVLVQLVTAPTFDPQNLEWIPSGRQPSYLELRRIGDFQQPQFAALYDPQRIEWMPSERYSGRGLQSAPYDLSVYTVLVIPPATPADIVPLYVMIDGFHRSSYGLKP